MVQAQRNREVPSQPTGEADHALGLGLPRMLIEEDIDAETAAQLTEARDFMMASPHDAESSLAAFDAYSSPPESPWHALITNRATRTFYFFDNDTLKAIKDDKLAIRLRHTPGEEANLRLYRRRLEIFLHELQDSRRDLGATALGTPPPAAA